MEDLRFDSDYARDLLAIEAQITTKTPYEDGLRHSINFKIDDA
jgi:hypothetical protein